MPATPSALATFLGRGLMPTHLNSEDLVLQIGRETKELSFFMAQVTDTEILQKFYDETGLILSGKQGHGDAIKNISLWLDARGYKPKPGKEGSLEDLRSLDRIGVVLDTNVRMAQGYANYLRDLQRRDEYPARKFVRIGQRREPRIDWPQRCRAAYEATKDIPGVVFHDGEWIALIDHPFWVALSAFGNPYSPFDYNSGMGTKPVSRSRSEELGILPKPDEPQPPAPGEPPKPGPLPSLPSDPNPAPAVPAPVKPGPPPSPTPAPSPVKPAPGPAPVNPSPAVPPAPVSPPTPTPRPGPPGTNPGDPLPKPDGTIPKPFVPPPLPRVPLPPVIFVLPVPDKPKPRVEPPVSWTQTYTTTPQVTEPELRDLLALLVGMLGLWIGTKLIFTDPNGTRKATADTLVDLWQRPAPDGLGDIPQRDLIALWEGGDEAVSTTEDFHLSRLFSRIVTEQVPDAAWRSFGVTDEQAESLIGLDPGDAVEIPDFVPAWEFSGNRVNPAGDGWQVVMKVAPANRIIDARALRVGTGGYVYRGGQRFIVESTTPDEETKTITLITREG